MSDLLRAAQQVVIVERRQFALCDGSAPYESHVWQLPDRDPDGGVSVNRDGVMVASTIPMHDAEVQVELWSGEPPEVGEQPIGEVAIWLPSGSLTAWAVPHGPAGDPIELQGAGEYGIRVFRRGGGYDALTHQQQGCFTGLESYLVQTWRHPQP